MFNTWLTYLEKETFLIRLEDDGWKFKEDKHKLSYAGTSLVQYKVQKIPKDFGKKAKSFIKVTYNGVNNKYKVELYDTKVSARNKDK